MAHGWWLQAAVLLFHAAVERESLPLPLSSSFLFCSVSFNNGRPSCPLGFVLICFYKISLPGFKLPSIFPFSLYFIPFFFGLSLLVPPSVRSLLSFSPPRVLALSRYL